MKTKIRKQKIVLEEERREEKEEKREKQLNRVEVMDKSGQHKIDQIDGRLQGKEGKRSGNGSSTDFLLEDRIIRMADPEAAISTRVAVLKTYKLYIGGSFVRSESGRYYHAYETSGACYANLCLASRKDFRNAVVAARNAFPRWSSYSAYNRGQILYRMAEMLEGRRGQFIQELIVQALSPAEAEQEVYASIDQLIYYAGWCDKYQQVFSNVNPVASSHFNFSVPEPMGVVVLLPPDESPLLAPISLLAAAIAGANTAILLADYRRPLPMLSFAEVLHSSDLPGGVLNLLSGKREELLAHIASHMDVNAVVYCGRAADQAAALEKAAVENMKRVIVRSDLNWRSPEESRNPYWLMDTQEIKTTWHPIEKISAEGGKY